MLVWCREPQVPRLLCSASTRRLLSWWAVTCAGPHHSRHSPTTGSREPAGINTNTAPPTQFKYFWASLWIFFRRFVDIFLIINPAAAAREILTGGWCSAVVHTGSGKKCSSALAAQYSNFLSYQISIEKYDLRPPHNNWLNVSVV